MTMWQPTLVPGSMPRYLAIAEAVERDVKAGRLKRGDRLPTHRDLAEGLGVTVGTVTRGYAEAARRGLVRGETGRGTYISGSGADGPVMNHCEETPMGAVDMGLTLPLSHLDPDLGAALTAIADSGTAQDLLRYYPSAGRRVDRETGAAWLNRYNLTTTPDNVIVCAGGQHALAVLMGSLFRPGDAVAVEAITYPMFKSLARRFRIKLVPVAQDEQGMTADGLEAACARGGVRGVYLMPTCQNPTASRMGDFRRRELAEIARRFDLAIIEDEAYALVAGAEYTPLSELAPERGYFIGSLSKGVSGGLRAAYLSAPQAMVGRLEQCVAELLWMVPPLMVEVARRWIEDGTADATIVRKRQEATYRAQLAGRVLGGLSFRCQRVGYFAWLELPEPWNACDFGREAKDRGVRVTTGDVFMVGRAPQPHAVRLSLSGPDSLDDLKRGLIAVRRLLDERL